MKKHCIRLLVVSLIMALTFAFVTPVLAATIKLDHKSLKMYPKQTVTLKVKGTTKIVKWSSSKKKVATVNSEGVVTAKKSGSCTIYAKVAGKKLKCKVTVKTNKAYAKKLRKYLLKKKKYTLKKEYVGEENETCIITIKANKKNKKIEFYYLLACDTPANVYRFVMTIDLESNKEGTFSTYYAPDYIDYYSETEGKINKTAYTTSSTNNGLTFTYINDYYYDDEDDHESDATIKAIAGGITRDAFYEFDALIKTKTGLMMNLIGFTSY